MTKKEINVLDYSNEINKALNNGYLLTTKGDNVNTMIIGWGTVGIIWREPIFIAYVRESRYTREILDKTNEFTVNIPINGYDSKIFEVCGSQSGRDIDKIKECDLTLIDPEIINTPAIKELPLTLECKVVYKQKWTDENMDEEILNTFFPDDGTGFRDFHIAYYGKIESAYIIEE